jgi:hypothetical protein
VITKDLCRYTTIIVRVDESLRDHGREAGPALFGRFPGAGVARPRPALARHRRFPADDGTAIATSDLIPRTKDYQV